MGLPTSAYAQIDSLRSANQVNRAYVSVGQRLATEGAGNTLLADQFDGSTLDTVWRWNTPVLTNSGTATVASGFLQLATSTVVSRGAAVTSQETFYPTAVGHILTPTIIQFEAGASGILPINVNAFFGLGTPNGSYTAATPLQEAIGFERDITGKFQCVYYNGATRTVVLDITSKILDGLPHLIFMRVRADTTYFFIDDAEEPVAKVSLAGPGVLTLPVRMHAMNHTAAPAVAPTVRFFGTGATDTASNYPLQWNGNVIQRQVSPFKYISVNALGIAAETTAWTPAAGKKFRLQGYVLTSGVAAGNVILKDNTAGTTILVIPFGAIAQTIVSPPMANGILSVAAGNVLTATGGAGQTLSGYFFGTEE